MLKIRQQLDQAKIETVHTCPTDLAVCTNNGMSEGGLHVLIVGLAIQAEGYKRAHSTGEQVAARSYQAEMTG